MIFLLIAAGACVQANHSAPGRIEHPLLPGVRSPEVWNKSWPNALHDKLLTGFSPLTCGMRDAPKLWLTIRPGGRATYSAFCDDKHGKPFLLVQDGALRRIDSAGNVVWRRSARRALFCERLHGDETLTLGALSGNSLVLLDPDSGEPFWQHRFDGAVDLDKVRLAKVLPDRPGKQIVVFPQYVTTGYLFAFRSGQREPELVWKTDQASVANWSSPADHGVMTIVEPDGSVIWNVRHHTINTHDPRTGERLRRFEFNSGGGKRRNYGPSTIGQAADGRPLIAIAGQFVQHHLTCFFRHQSSPPELIFDRYVGEVYEDHGVKAWFPVSGIGDADGDGGLDIIYSVRLTQPELRTQTILCDVASGRELVIADTWLAGAADLNGDRRKEIFAYADPRAEMPNRGTLEVYRLDEKKDVERIYKIDRAELVLRPVAPTEQPAEAAWCRARLETPVILPAGRTVGALIRDYGSRTAKILKMSSDAVSEQTASDALFQHDVLAVGKWERDGPWRIVLQTSSGRLSVVDLEGDQQFELPLGGNRSTLASAEDLTGDGACEILAHSAQDQVEVFTFAGDLKTRRLWSAPFVAKSSRLSPPVGDIDGDGRPDVMGAGYSANSRLCVRLHAADGRILWESPLPMPGSGEIRRWLVGDFFGPGHAGIFVPRQQGQAREESYMLDGRDGHIVWTGLPQQTPNGVRACNPIGIPAAFDADGDGKEDVILDYRDFVAIHRGSDGAFIRDITLTPTVPAGWKMAYNSYTPLRDPKGDLRFLVSLGHGGVGLLAEDLTTEIWTHKPYYDTPARVAMIDVDGDGRLEAGYEESRSGWFVCRDMHSGEEQWRLKLDGAGYGGPISADFDGDGKGEFLIGNACIGDAKGQGEIRWCAKHSAGWPAIADFDGDGQGEILMPGGGGVVRVLRASSN